MPTWFISICMDGAVREVRAKIGEGAKLELDIKTWSLWTNLFADNMVLLVQSKEKLQV